MATLLFGWPGTFFRPIGLFSGYDNFWNSWWKLIVVNNFEFIKKLGQDIKSFESFWHFWKHLHKFTQTHLNGPSTFQLMTPRNAQSTNSLTATTTLSRRGRTRDPLWSRTTNRMTSPQTRTSSQRTTMRCWSRPGNRRSSLSYDGDSETKPRGRTG